MKTYLDSLEDLLLLKLRVLYDVEHELNKFVPRVARTIKHKELRKIVQQHARCIPSEIQKLERIFNCLGLKPRKEKSAGIRGIITDTKWLLTVEASDEARDAALVAALQYMEHYEITAYGTAYAWAKQLGLQAIAEQLEYIGREEMEVDANLTELSKPPVNQQAERQFSGNKVMHQSLV